MFFIKLSLIFFMALTISKIWGCQNGNNTQNFEFLVWFLIGFFSSNSLKYSLSEFSKHILYLSSSYSFQDKGGQKEPKGSITQTDKFFSLICIQFFFHWTSLSNSCLDCFNSFFSIERLWVIHVWIVLTVFFPLNVFE